MVKFYYRHTASNKYPFINISYKSAFAFCNWQQQQIQAENPNYEITISLHKKRTMDIGGPCQ
jgi:hypothetical protein